jgi:hypothetical protein
MDQGQVSEVGDIEFAANGILWSYGIHAELSLESSIRVFQTELAFVCSGVSGLCRKIQSHVQNFSSC